MFCKVIWRLHLSCNMRYPSMWYVRPAKSQISLRICAVWSEPFLVARIFNECQATGRTSLGVSNLKGRPHRLAQVYTCQNATWLEITCRGSFMPRREKTCLRDPDIVRRWEKIYLCLCKKNRHIGSLVSLPFTQRTTRPQTQTVWLDRLVVVPVVIRTCMK